MNDIEELIVDILRSDFGKRFTEFPGDAEDIAEVLVQKLGLYEQIELSHDTELRWWATGIQHRDGSGEWQWPTTR